MSWTKLGDEFGDVTASLSDAAVRTHIDALNYSNRLLLDLIVPKKALIRFANSDSRDAAAYELTAAGWWEDRGPEWFIGCRFPEWQQESAEVIRRRGQMRDAQTRRRRHARGEHDMCLPSKCPNAMSSQVSSLVSSDDSSGVSGGVSGTGRDGTGRDGTTSHPTVPGEAPRADPRDGASHYPPPRQIASEEQFTTGLSAVRTAAGIRKET